MLMYNVLQDKCRFKNLYNFPYITRIFFLISNFQIEKQANLSLFNANFHQIYLRNLDNTYKYSIFSVVLGNL